MKISKEEAVRCAAHQVGALAIEVGDMLMRFPRLNKADVQTNCPDALLAAFYALYDARAALLAFEQAANDAAPRAYMAHEIEVIPPTRDEPRREASA